MASPESTGFTLQEMRNLCRKGLGNLTPADLSNEDVDRYLNMSFWDVEARFPFKSKECITEFPTVVGENGYLVPNEGDVFDLESIQALTVIDTDNISHPLQRWEVWKWNEEYSHAQGTDAYALPEYYVRVDETIWLHPTPDKIYTLRLYLLKSLKTLLSGTVDEPDLPRNWHEIVVEGAIVRGQFYRREYDQAQQAANFPLAKTRAAVMVKAKEEIDSHYSGLEVLHDWPI